MEIPAFADRATGHRVRLVAPDGSYRNIVIFATCREEAEYLAEENFPQHHLAEEQS